MNFVDLAVRWRHGTLALFCLLTLFGTLAIFQLPLELQPGGDKPEISVTTAYPGAGPTVVEDLITRPIEERLEEVEGIQQMTSSSTLGASSITMEFEWGVDIDDRLVAVINKLNQVQNLPAEATESDVQVASGGAGANAVMWIVVSPREGGVPDPNHYRDLVEDVLVPELRRVEGTSRFITVGGLEREIEVIVNPRALSDRGLRITEVTDALRRNNRDVRGGPLVVGRREYRVSTQGRAVEVDDLNSFVLRRDENGTVYLRDVARTQEGRKFKDGFFLYNGGPAAAIGVVKRVGANVPDLSKRLRATIAQLEQQLNAQGESIKIGVAYDEADYVAQSVALVRQNLLLGGFLATLVLLLFLGSIRTVLVCAISIPTTLICVFLALGPLGQTLNILTLAGLAFAVGMVVDNAIVVVENIFSHLEKGRPAVQAAIDGTKEVGGAMLASTLTTVAVFFPLVLVEGEAGRVFQALGTTLASAVLISLFAALTLVPMLSGLLLDKSEAELKTGAGGFTGWAARASAAFRRLQVRWEKFLLDTADISLGPEKRKTRFIILAACAGVLALGLILLPPPDYLPEGNRNLIFWLAEPYPGTSVEEGQEIMLPPRMALEQVPEVGDYFVVYRGGFKGIGVKLKPEVATGANLQKVLGQLMPMGFGFPGFRFMFPIRIPIFSDPGKSYEVRLVGPDLDELAKLDREVSGTLRGLPGVVNVRSDFVYGAPELQVRPDRLSLADAGIDPAELGAVVEAALGGRLASEFVVGKESLDVTVKLENTRVETPEDLRQLTLHTPSGGQVQVQDVAVVDDTVGPNQVNHVNLERSITLTVSLAPNAPLGSAVEAAQTQVLDPLREKLSRGYRAYISGSADQLSATLSQLLSVFGFSLFITYLLLMALYRSFVYPLVIMITVPLGLTGAVLSLLIVDAIPGWVISLDMITGLGFVILTGVVVNNAILLVDRALQLQREGLEFFESIRQATKDRIRPIIMSAATSVLGMLPLALIPGEGAELYQGLGIVLTGGLAFSTFLTPTVVPALMGILYDVGISEQDEDLLTKS